MAIFFGYFGLIVALSIVGSVIVGGLSDTFGISCWATTVILSAVVGIALVSWVFPWVILIVGPVVAIWFIYSIGAVGPDEVALRSWFGRLEKKKILRSGLCFVPWHFGILKFDGHPLCKLVRIPKKQFKFFFPGSSEDRVWSKDRQQLLVDVGGYIRFPYDEIKFLIQMIEAGVPLEEERLQRLIKQEVISGIKDILGGFDHSQAIGKSNLAAIRDAAIVFFHDPNGLFYRSGICGKDPNITNPGTGEVIIRVETVNPTPELQRAMEAPVVAQYKADAAKDIAKRKAEEIGGQILGTVARSHGMTVQELEADIKAYPEKRGKSIKEGGYAETFTYAEDQVKRDRAIDGLEDIRVGNVDGTPLEPGIATIAAMFGLGKRKGNRRSGSGPGDQVP